MKTESFILKCTLVMLNQTLLQRRNYFKRYCIIKYAKKFHVYEFFHKTRSSTHLHLNPLLENYIIFNIIVFF